MDQNQMVECTVWSGIFNCNVFWVSQVYNELLLQCIKIYVVEYKNW